MEDIVSYRSNRVEIEKIQRNNWVKIEKSKVIIKYRYVQASLQADDRLRHCPDCIVYNVAFIYACIQQMLMEKREQQEGLAAASDAVDHFYEVGMLPAYQFVQVFVSLYNHFIPRKCH